MYSTAFDSVSDLSGVSLRPGAVESLSARSLVDEVDRWVETLRPDEYPSRHRAQFAGRHAAQDGDKDS